MSLIQAPQSITLASNNSPLTSVVGGWIVAVNRALEELNIDSSAYLTELGIDLSSGVEDRRFNATQTQQIWQWALQRSQREDIGLLAGYEVGPTTFHALGFSLWASSSFLMALHRMVRFQVLLNDGCELTITHQPNLEVGDYCFTISPKQQHNQTLVTDQGIDYFCAAVTKVQRDLCGAAEHPQKVYLTRAKPTNWQVWEAYFACPVEFGCQQNCITYTADIENSLSTASPLLAEQNDELVKQYLARTLEQDLITQVRNTLIDTMPQGLTTAEQIAPLLNLTERSLRYQLNKKNTNLQTIRDEVRAELSQHYLLFSDLPFTQIAYTLGFSDPAHYNRACKRWTNKTPSQVRAPK